MSASIINKSYKKLSMLVSLQAVSYCIFDLLSGTIKHFNTINFNNSEALEIQFEKIFENNPELISDFDNVLVLHNNNYNAFVPEALFNNNELNTYLQYTTKVFETDFFTFDKIQNFEINNVYIPFININNFLLDRYKSFEYKNSNSILVSKLLENVSNEAGTVLFVNFQESNFELVILSNQKLLLYNSFEYKTKEDFVYYLLFTIEQLNLSPETAKVILLGNINENDPCYTFAYNYIRDISFLKTDYLQQKWNKTQQEILQNYILFNS